MLVMKVCVLLALMGTAVAKGNLSPTPPMGWMSWEIFRCDTDCTKDPDMCISQKLYQQMTDHLANDGYLDAGYDGIHIDDCWMERSPSRTDGKLKGDSVRFADGMKALGDYMHDKKVKYALYTAESPTTCAGYPASANNEDVDAKTFAEWGVDYLKVDGCGDNGYYTKGYEAMGNALINSGRDIVYSCSWPAYIGSDETVKPFATFIADHCNLWRNWHDIQCNWESAASIIDHWGDYQDTIRTYAGPGHWNDPDMLLVGNPCITDDEARTQFAMWCIWAAPLIMGNDLRNITDTTKAILLNKEAIAVNQDPQGVQGIRVNNGSTQVWYKPLADGSVAVGLYNKDGPDSPNPPPACPTWNMTTGGYGDCGAAGNILCFNKLTLEQAKQECCDNKDCDSFSFNPKAGDGCFKKSHDCTFQNSTDYVGYLKPHFTPPSPSGLSAKITVNFIDVGLTGNITVRDIWKQADVGVFSTNYTQEVPFHGTAFLKLSAAP